MLNGEKCKDLMYNKIMTFSNMVKLQIFPDQDNTISNGSENNNVNSNKLK